MIANNNDFFLISDFNINNFASLLQNDTSYPSIKTTISPFGQVIQSLITFDTNSTENAKPDYCLIWTQPERIIKTFERALKYESIPHEDIIKEVIDYSKLLLKILLKVRALFIPIWVLPTYCRGYGILDMRADIGISNVLMHMNMALIENLKNASNIFIMNTTKWIESASGKSFDPRLWYMAKIPFSDSVFTGAVKDIKSALNGICGNAKKIIILDLDDTLWGGIVGDTGWENIVLGGHDHIGEAFLDFQKALKSLTNRGILLGIVSKNEETVALEAIKKHPEMVLKISDFAGWRINWNDKAQNIVELTNQLNLGLQSVVFIDDNPAERARVKEALPEVFVPDWPGDKMFYKSTLLNLRCFDNPSVSAEDLKRVQMYEQEQKRNQIKKEVSSLGEWLKSLNITVTVEQLNATNIQRTAQLFNKTNQMNLSTRRMTETEILEWLTKGHRRFWVYRYSDNFGDSGLIGILSLDITGKKAQIIDFILSCRVMGRNIEEIMVYTAIRYSSEAGIEEIVAEYIPTEKNAPCFKFWESTSFQFEKEKTLFSFNTRNKSEPPSHINLVVV